MCSQNRCYKEWLVTVVCPYSSMEEHMTFNHGIPVQLWVGTPYNEEEGFYEYIAIFLY